MLRLVGTLSSAALVNVLLTTDVETSTMGDCPLTSTICSTAPIFMVTSTRALKPTGSVKPLRTSFRKPEMEYSMRYTPGGKLESRYDPWPSDVVLWPRWRAGLDTSMVTPGSTAPLSSIMVPNTAPFCTVSCAYVDLPALMRTTLITTPAAKNRIAKDMRYICTSHSQKR